MSSVFFGGSSQEVASVFRVIPRVAGKTETAVFGKDKNAAGQLIPDENNVYKYSPLQDKYATISYNDLDYYLNPEQLKEFSKYRMDFLGKVSEGDAKDMDYYKKLLAKFEKQYATIESRFKEIKGVKKNKVFDKLLNKIKINEIPADKDINDLVNEIAQMKIIAKYLNKEDKLTLKLDLKDEVTKE